MYELGLVAAGCFGGVIVLLLSIRCFGWQWIPGSDVAFKEMLRTHFDDVAESNRHALEDFFFQLFAWDDDDDFEWLRNRYAGAPTFVRARIEREILRRLRNEWSKIDNPLVVLRAIDHVGLEEFVPRTEREALLIDFFTRKRKRRCSDVALFRAAVEFWGTDNLPEGVVFALARMGFLPGLLKTSLLKSEQAYAAFAHLIDGAKNERALRAAAPYLRTRYETDSTAARDISMALAENAKLYVLAKLWTKKSIPSEALRRCMEAAKEKGRELVAARCAVLLNDAASLMNFRETMTDPRAVGTVTLAIRRAAERFEADAHAGS